MYLGTLKLAASSIFQAALFYFLFLFFNRKFQVRASIDHFTCALGES